MGAGTGGARKEGGNLVRALLAWVGLLLIATGPGCSTGTQPSAPRDRPGEIASNQASSAQVDGAGKAAGDGPGLQAPVRAARGAPAAAVGGETATNVTNASSKPLIIALGDSLTAGYGLSQAASWPALLQSRLEQQGRAWRVVNGGVSGDTLAGGASRLEWLLKQRPRIVVVALGGNDALRGLPVEQARAHLEDIVGRCQAAGAQVLLAGMLAPPNMGEAYGQAFKQVYVDVARTRGVPLLPFLLEGVAGDPSLNQADRIHPTAEGQRRLLDNVWSQLEPLLEAG